ncbi:hypothetical protein [Photobacterium nomapromontoriensis]|uniref:hypothetical protein n=1 Tax=Photobacterium nomapromontoriensis TaxID=2910237 RepID=UPI003D0F9A8B
MVSKSQLPARKEDINIVHEDRQEQPMSMHEGIAIWCDCCVCEAEPYWADHAEELGVSLSNYEEGKEPK